MGNKSGRALTIFLSALLTVFFSAFCISLFYLHKETENTKVLQTQLEEIQGRESELTASLKDTEKQVFILEEKNKEADEKINSLLDDLELESGLREEIKNENATLKQALESETKSKDELRKKLSVELEAAQKSLNTVEKELKEEQKRARDLSDKLVSLQKEKAELETEISRIKIPSAKTSVPQEPAKQEQDNVSPKMVDPDNQSSKEDVPTEDLASPANLKDPKIEEFPPEAKEEGFDKIVVTNEPEVEGRVLSVDVDTEFMIINLGRADGIEEGALMSIWRGRSYMGDVKVSRVQDEMSAADFIPPFSSRKVRKNDQVKIKEFE